MAARPLPGIIPCNMLHFNYTVPVNRANGQSSLHLLQSCSLSERLGTSVFRELCIAEKWVFPRLAHGLNRNSTCRLPRLSSATGSFKLLCRYRLCTSREAPQHCMISGARTILQLVSKGTAVTYSSSGCQLGKLHNLQLSRCY